MFKVWNTFKQTIAGCSNAESGWARSVGSWHWIMLHSQIGGSKHSQAEAVISLQSESESNVHIWHSAGPTRCMQSKRMFQARSRTWADIGLSGARAQSKLCSRWIQWSAGASRYCNKTTYTLTLTFIIRLEETTKAPCKKQDTFRAGSKKYVAP